MKKLVSILFVITIALQSCDNSKKDNGDKTTTSKTEKKEPKITTKEQVTNPLITIGKKDSVGNEIDNGKKKIYLTFDDGPNPGTRIVIDALKEAKLPATFYMIGLHRYYGPMQENLFKEVNKEPTFEVVNHSFTHAYKNNFPKYYADVNGAVNDFIRNQDSLKFNNTIIRGPGSNVWRLKGTYIDHKFQKRTEIMDSLYKLGYYITGWDWEWTHYKNKAKQTPEQLLSEINGLFASKKTNKPNYLVLLTHDAIFADTADAAKLKDFFIKLKADPQFEFRVISQYPGAEAAFKQQ
jgi:peptidoglycan-N-acetylglucosamine deacetylase